MKTKIPFLAIAFFLVTACGNKMLKEAEKAYSNEQFHSAATLYEDLLIEHSDPKTMLHLADCYYHMNRFADAEKWYSKAIESSQATAQDKLHYAEVLKQVGKCPVAIPLYNDYLKTSVTDMAAKNQKVSCESSAEFEVVNPFYVTQLKDFGFGGSCFSPAKFGKDLLVTASVPATIGVPVDDRTGYSYLDLYVVSLSENEIIAANTAATDLIAAAHKVVLLEGDVNTSLHEGPAILSPLSNTLFFTRSIRINNQVVKAKDNFNRFELCSAELVNDKWTNIRVFPFNSKEYSVGHPALTSDGKRLFFVSDMPGGMGGTDIYYCDFISGAWTQPVNAGSKINTDGDEMFPAIRMIKPGTDEFYFSSDGLPGAGGLDLFCSKMENEMPQNPVRMTAPFNSTFDDFGILFNSGGLSGYFSSNRNSPEGKDDVFAFHRLSPNYFVKVDVVLKGTLTPIPQSSIEVKNSRTGEMEILMADENGAIVFPADSFTNYAFTVRKDGYFTNFGSAVTPGFEGKLNDTTRVMLDMDQIVINKCIRLENIFYDYNKWFIRPEAAVELDKLVKIMIDNPAIVIELGSHTDSRGSDAYNLKLSDKRAKSAVDYIISKGISKNRITSKGYGEKVLLNKCSNGVKCTEEEHQWNRRTEFAVKECIPK